MEALASERDACLHLALNLPAQANDRCDPPTVGITALAWPARNAARARNKRARAPNSAPRDTVLACCIRDLFCLFFGFGNRFLVLLLVLLHLSFGLIGRDILRLGQSISSFIGCSGLFSGVSRERCTNSCCCGVSQRCRILAARGTANLILDGSHWITHIAQRRRCGLDRSLNGSADGFAGSSKG